LGFTHPTIDTPVEYRAPLPADIKGLIQILRDRGPAHRPTVTGLALDMDELMEM
jgi:hypothetical protein